MSNQKKRKPTAARGPAGSGRIARPEPGTPGSVMVGYLHPQEVAHSWHASFVALLSRDLQHHGRVVRGGWLATRCGTGGLVQARNQTVAGFLTDERRPEWLFWIDTDMGFQADIIDALIEVADPVERPIVGALCFAQKETGSDLLHGYRCAPRATLYDWHDGDGTPQDPPGFMGRAVYPVNTLTRVAGTGSAAILIHRTVFERMADAFGGPVWYDPIPNPVSGNEFSEDLSFCVRANALDIPVHVHTGVRTSHLKHQWVQEADYWTQFLPAPTRDRCTVLVPTIRTGTAAAFMASLRASTGMADVVMATKVGMDDVAAEWAAEGARVVFTETGTFAAGVNAGYAATSDPWVFITGDDVRFHPGWLDHATTVAGDRWHVVGTADLGNPRVMAGEHAVHMLLRRSYVEEHGGSWDGPGVLAHEGYGHWYVDDEIVSTARQRGVFTVALGAVVEHLHPLFGKGAPDEVYELGQSRAAADKALFVKRAADAGVLAGGA